MKSVAVALLWHLHQPYYTDPLTRTAPFPWVRLHATKGYFDMAVLLEEHADVQATVNLTPSLLLQIQEQAGGTVADTFRTHAAMPAADLTEEQRAFILRHFFAANWDTMIRPHERYYGLLIQRGREVRDADLTRLAQRFAVQDLLDLQVWHNLAWFGHRAVARYPNLKTLLAKGRQFTESDKQEVLSIQREVLTQLIPLFRKLQERGQIELSTTPFFHPILPLLIDTDFARRARPETALPARFAHPEDARAQLRMAVEFHTHLFGKSPVGLWPSEGSVCPEMIPMLAEAGIGWTATDEAVLAGSVDGWDRDAQLYQPYLVTHEGSEVTVLFRDRDLSDAVGFTYSKNEAASAVADFVGRLNAAAERAHAARPIVSVILDGENPWEYYLDGGEGFLRGLYRALGGESASAVRFEAVTPSRELAQHPAVTKLPRLHTGSWINADFRIWIGHPEDNDAWTRVGKTRRYLERQEQEAPPPSAELLHAAWQELYAAEGSDWFWWYGDDFETDHKAIFDQLFRVHLGNVFRLLGREVPEFLLLPVWRRVTSEASEAAIREPIALISPTIDGSVTDFFEWRGAGSLDGQLPLNAMYKGPSVFSRIYFGFNLEQFFLRFDLADASPPGHVPTDEIKEPIDRSMDAPVEVVAQFLDPHPSKLVFPLQLPERPRFTLFKSADGMTFVPERSYDTIQKKKIIELAVPLKDLGLEHGSEVQLVIKVLEGGFERERLPHYQPLTLKVPDDTFEARMWKA